MKNIRNIKFTATESSREVSGILLVPENPAAILVFAHGAGAPMNHPFMNKTADNLFNEGIATLRYNFPYTEKKLKRIDPPPVLLETVRSAIKTAKNYAKNIPLLAGGKSMGGRMTSQAAAEENFPDGVTGIVFFGFPLHPPGRESTERAEHLFKVKLPMLFLQGTRDKLANPDLLKPVISKIGRKVSLHLIEGADHSFHMLKSSGRKEDEVLKEIASGVRVWTDSIIKKIIL